MGNLIKCKDCERMVSKDAKTCPGCGAKVPTLTNALDEFAKASFGCGCLLLIIGMLMLLVFI